MMRIVPGARGAQHIVCALIALCLGLLCTAARAEGSYPGLGNFLAWVLFSAALGLVILVTPFLVIGANGTIRKSRWMLGLLAIDLLAWPLGAMGAFDHFPDSFATPLPWLACNLPACWWTFRYLKAARVMRATSTWRS